MAQGELRNRSSGAASRSKKEKSGSKRRNQKKKEKSVNDGQPSAAGSAAATANGSPGNNEDYLDQTLWEVFKSHPFVIVAPYVLIPAALYYLYLYVTLKRPDLASAATLGAVSLRPAVRTEDPRQVLILGSLGSGAVQVAEALRDIMKLEVYHEVADATSFFTRDGTASSLLAWRYSDDLSGGRLSHVLDDLCLNRTKDTQLFKPSMLQPTTCFSLLGGWSKCHVKECVALIGREYGCAMRKGPNQCQPRFVRVLHQARHPLAVISELMTSVCPSYAQKKDCTIHPAFAQFATVFVDHDSEFDSCLAIVAWYVIRYNRALLTARSKGLVDAMFTYEDSALCDVARLAGFTDPDLVVYPPNLPMVSSKCSPEAMAKADAAQAKPLPALVSKTDTTRKFPSYSWSEFDEAGGSKLVNALKKLCKDMGYDPNAIKESGETLSTVGADGKKGMSK
jgi:hypothetical protein